ncbi:MAG: DNA-3-methyladenine glycosylase I [Bacteroidetes bacterium]|nr:DNA-3-methyladenine glycosylase I [Bacteroidota bacterium]
MENHTQSGCHWPGEDTLMLAYHDQEWGVPLHDDRKLFEFLVLDAFQAGLSWKTILHKRKNFEQAFAKFDPNKVAKFSMEKVETLMQNAGIIRNRLKITGTISNAQCFLDVQKEFGSFDQYIWQFVHHQPISNKWESGTQIPTKSPESDAMSKDLRMRGFKFVGSTICYAFMQAAGMINDHLIGCPRHAAINKHFSK